MGNKSKNITNNRMLTKTFLTLWFHKTQREEPLGDPPPNRLTFFADRSRILNHGIKTMV